MFGYFYSKISRVHTDSFLVIVFQTFKRYVNAAIRAVNQLLGFLQIGLVSAAVGDLTSLTVGDLIIQFERIINNVVITARDSRTVTRRTGQSYHVIVGLNPGFKTWTIRILFLSMHFFKFRIQQ